MFFLWVSESGVSWVVLILAIILGKSGIITTANGLRIACLGGVYDAEIYNSADAALVS
jgi:hypothetical protein